MGRISELKRYLSILASPTPRDITDTLSVDHDKQNRVEDELPCSLNFGYELTGELQFRRCGYHRDDRKLLSRLCELFELSSCPVHLRIDDLSESCYREFARPAWVVDHPQSSEGNVIV